MRQQQTIKRVVIISGHPPPKFNNPNIHMQLSRGNQLQTTDKDQKQEQIRNLESQS
jgi:hypothetical protein